MAGQLYLGTSGFAYEEWKGVFYPSAMKSVDYLSFYSERFPSVEINYTFRRHPAETTLSRWAGQTPEGFRFVLKAHQRITHTKRLRDADEPVSMFLDRAKLLGERLGPILFQLPPTFHYDRAALEGFLGYLPPMYRYAFEFRHPSWAEARDVLASQGAAWVVAETDEQAAGEMSWEPFGYLRLRKEEYTEEELQAWARKISSAMAGGSDVYVFLKHEEKGAGPKFAERLSELIGQAG